jgi:hypothetical protein
MLLAAFATNIAVAQQAAADTRGLDALRRCSAALDPIGDIGFERVVARCPDLPAALDAASWSALLPPNWRERSGALSRDGLLALIALVAERDTVRPMRAPPDPQQVAQTLADVGAVVDDKSSRWERLKRWLRGVFKRADENERDGLLRRMFGPLDVGDAVARVLTYVGYAVLIGFALFVVLQELRASGIVGGRSRTRRRSLVDALAHERRLSMSDITRAPLADRPGLYLRWLSEAWRAARTDVPAPAMTATELRNSVAALAPSLEPAMTRLAQTADAIRYGERVVSDADLELTTQAASEALAALARDAQTQSLLRGAS